MESTNENQMLIDQSEKHYKKLYGWSNFPSIYKLETENFSWTMKIDAQGFWWTCVVYLISNGV